jgi:DNA-binding IclR family transcriptional regulator
MALLLIGRKRGILAGELAEVLHLHPATISGIVGRLERAGLIVREDDAEDARRSAASAALLTRSFSVSFALSTGVRTSRARALARRRWPRVGLWQTPRRLVADLSTSCATWSA